MTYYIYNVLTEYKYKQKNNPNLTLYKANVPVFTSSLQYTKPPGATVKLDNKGTT